MFSNQLLSLHLGRAGSWWVKNIARSKNARQSRTLPGLGSTRLTSAQQVGGLDGLVSRLSPWLRKILPDTLVISPAALSLQLVSRKKHDLANHTAGACKRNASLCLHKKCLALTSGHVSVRLGTGEQRSRDLSDKVQRTRLLIPPPSLLLPLAFVTSPHPSGTILPRCFCVRPSNILGQTGSSPC